MKSTRARHWLFAACGFALLAACMPKSARDADKALLYLHLGAADLAIESEAAFQAGDDWQALGDVIKDMQAAMKAVPADDPRAKKVAALVDEAAQTVAEFDRNMADVKASHEASAAFAAHGPDASKKWDRLLRAMAEGGAPVEQLMLANREILLMDRMSQRATEMLAGNERAVTAADAFARDLEIYRVVHEGLSSGNPDIGVERAASAAAQAALKELKPLLDAQAADAEKEFERIQALVSARDAVDRLRAIRLELLEAAPPRY